MRMCAMAPSQCTCNRDRSLVLVKSNFAIFSSVCLLDYFSDKCVVFETISIATLLYGHDELGISLLGRSSAWRGGRFLLSRSARAIRGPRPPPLLVLGAVERLLAHTVIDLVVQLAHPLHQRAPGMRDGRMQNQLVLHAVGTVYSWETRRHGRIYIQLLTKHVRTGWSRNTRCKVNWQRTSSRTGKIQRQDARTWPCPPAALGSAARGRPPPPCAENPTSTDPPRDDREDT